MSADKGISKPEALWGNFLIRLRELFKGNLSKYKVPVSNELLASVEEIRKEVLRLSNELASETGKTTVIAIDGIDHAARAGENNTFLNTLIPPEGVPDKVCFLIAGQPIHQYDLYPDWLADTQRVYKIDIPPIDEDDIKQLYSTADIEIPQDSTEAAIKLINKTVAGNTLSAVFAIYEAKQCKSIEELEKLLEDKQLSSGISAYYEYIWKSAKNNIPKEFFYVDNILAGVLSLINKKITIETMTSICKNEDISKLAWTRVMQKLYPIVINIKGQYMVFHNDVRIYLEKYLRKDIDAFIDVASRLADYFKSGNGDIKIKHELLFTLLKYAKRESEFIDVFTKDFVIEALKLKRPETEIIEQLESTLNSFLTVKDFKKIINLNCAVATFYQFKQSLQWMDKQYEAEYELPIALNSEKKVTPKAFITADILRQMFNDTMLLIEHDEMIRAKNNISRWLGDLSPEDIVELLITNQGISEEENKAVEDINSVLEDWGRVSLYTGFNFSEVLSSQIDPEKAKTARKYFAKGWLDKGKLFIDENSFITTISEISYYFKEDLEFYINAVINSKNSNAILRISELVMKNEFSNLLKLRLVVWSLVNDKQDIYKEWLAKIQKSRFHYIEEIKGYYKDLFPFYSLIVFILSYSNYNQDTIIKECLSTFNNKTFSTKDRSYYSAHKLLVSSSFCGFLSRCINNNSTHLINIKEFEVYVNHLFDTQDMLEKDDINGIRVEKFLLNQIIIMIAKLDKTFQDLLLKILETKARDYDHIYHIDIYWDYLMNNGRTSVLEELFERWMNVDGLVWKLEQFEMNEIAEDFISKALELKWIDKAENAKKLLENKLISYVGRKDYSLYPLSRWYERISILNNIYWETEGVQLLNLSKCASDIGDNRASVYIDAAVAVSAGRQGVKSMWTFANLKDKWNTRWLETIFDGVISALEYNDFTEDDLLSIWKVSTKIFFVTGNDDDNKDRLRSIYIADIKEAIILAAKRLNFIDIEKDMEEIASLEFSQKREPENYRSFRLPTRWFEYKDERTEKNLSFINKTKSLSHRETLNILEQQFINDRNEFKWDFVVELIRRIEQDSSANVCDYLPKILELLFQRTDAYFWEWDGADRLYEKIFKYLNNKQITKIFKELLKNYFTSKYSDASRLYGLNSDLEHFTYSYYSKLPETENVAALNELLKMHIDWITGNGRVPLTIHFRKQEVIDDVLSWSDFCKKLRIHISNKCSGFLIMHQMEP